MVSLVGPVLLLIPCHEHDSSFLRETRLARSRASNVAAFPIDTDWIIDHLNGIATCTLRLKELQPQGLAVSVISIAELWEGVHFSRDPAGSRTHLQGFLQGVITLGVDDETCSRFGRLRGELRRQGRLIGDFDLLIAATALVHGLTLLTNNRRHFERIPELLIESDSAQA